MTLSLLTNLASLEAQKNVNRSQSTLQSSVERLSSGKRINHASDDAAGLAISSKLTAELRGLKQAGRNAQDAISMVQTAEGGLEQVNNLLSRMRELAVESANGGTLGNNERASINTEYELLNSEIDRIVQVTTYNGQKLLNGDLSSTSFQVGTYNTVNDRIELQIASVAASTLTVSSTAVSTMSGAQDAIQNLDFAIGAVAVHRALIGASQNRIAATVENLSTSYNNLSAANSRILDVDVAEESAVLARNTILLQAGISVLSQANQQPQAALQLLRGG